MLNCQWGHSYWVIIATRNRLLNDLYKPICHELLHWSLEERVTQLMKISACMTKINPFFFFFFRIEWEGRASPAFSCSIRSDVAECFVNVSGAFDTGKVSIGFLLTSVSRIRFQNIYVVHAHNSDTCSLIHSEGLTTCQRVSFECKFHATTPAMDLCACSHIESCNACLNFGDSLSPTDLRTFISTFPAD